MNADARRVERALERERGGRADRRVERLVGEQPENASFTLVAREPVDEVAANRLVDRRAREAARVSNKHEGDAACVEQAPRAGKADEAVA